MAMTLVSTVTVGSGGAASIEFTGIAGTGKDLLLLVSARTVRTELNDVVDLRFNSDSGSNYRNLYLQGNGSSASSTAYDHTSIRLDMINGDTSTSNTFGNLAFYVSNYTSSVAKSASADIVTENNATTSWQAIQAHRWTGTSAITSISLASGTSNNFKQYTTASLYIIS